MAGRAKPATAERVTCGHLDLARRVLYRVYPHEQVVALHGAIHQPIRVECRIAFVAWRRVVDVRGRAAQVPHGDNHIAFNAEGAGWCRHRDLARGNAIRSVGKHGALRALTHELTAHPRTPLTRPHAAVPRLEM